MAATARLLLLLSLLAVVPASVRGDACTDKGGTCVDWRDYVCHAGLETGLCPGDSNIRCCLPCDAQCEADEEEWSTQDGECEAAGGECKHNTNYCEGMYSGGLCGGPSERQCCKEECPGVRKGRHTSHKVPYLFVHHSETPACNTEEECAARVRSIQDYHMDTNGWSDIGYSFLVGGDGNIYEGRGFNVQGAHTSGYNSVGYGVCFIGSFMEEIPVPGAEDAFHGLAECMENNDKIASDYDLFGHRQAGSTDCPGDALYEEIQTWPHWTPGSPSK